MYRLATLETVRQCLELGARPRTTTLLTGLSTKAVLRLTAEAGLEIPRGRPPYSQEFFHAAAPWMKAQISVFAAKYEWLRSQQVVPAQALISAYRHCCGGAHVPSFSFDQAFFVISCLAGLWGISKRSLFLHPCSACASPHLVIDPGAPASSCPFCVPPRNLKPETAVLSGEVTARRDGRTIPATSLLARRIQALTLQEQLQQLGAHPRHVQILVSVAQESHDGIAAGRAGLGKPMPFEHWSVQVKTLDRAMLSAVASTFRRVHAAGCPAEQAFLAAYRHVKSLPCPDGVKLRFDHSFNVVAALGGRWGADRALELVECHRCGSLYLVSLLETVPAHCPFCQIKRRPGLFGFSDE